MNTSTQRLNFNMDELPVSRFTDAVVVGRVALESSINEEVRFYFNVDRFFDRKPYASGRKVVSWRR